MTTITPTTPARRPVSRHRPLLAGLLFALPLLLGMPERGDGADAPEMGELIGNWRYLDETDALGNHFRLAYTRARGSVRNLVATFVLRERNGAGTAFLLLSSDDPEASPPVPLCQEHGAPPVVVKFGDNAPLPTVCGTEISGSPRTLFLGPVLPLWVGSTFSETLSIGVTVAQQGLVVFTFPAGHVEWPRLLDPHQARYLARVTEQSSRGEDITRMWEMSISHDFRETTGAERSKQKSPVAPGATSRRDLHS